MQPWGRQRVAPTPYVCTPTHMRALVIAVASAGYVGYIPVASGTFGSLFGIPLFFAFDHLRAQSLVAYLGVYVLAVAASCWVAGKADEYLHEHDSHKIVIDEIVGYVAATLFVIPTWTNVALAFFIFRALDVIKPFPAGYIDEHFPGGYGVVLDDVASGVYTCLVMHALSGVGILA
jgi:phosphatidylglycerophosphatase A